MTTPQSPFAQPSAGGAGDKFDGVQLNGHLLLIYPGAVKTVPTQSFGDKEAIGAEVHVLDAVDQATGSAPVLRDTLIFGAVLIGQLRTEGQRGGMVLGRLGQGANTKGNAPWTLMDYTPQDEAVARAYIATHPREQFTQPQAQSVAQPPAWSATAVPGTPQHDMWAGVQAAPAGPPAGQWGTPPSGQQPSPQGAPSNGAATAAPAGAAPGNPAPQWGAPAASAQAAPAPAAPASPSAVDPKDAEILRSKGVNPDGMSAEQVRMIAATLGGPPF
ncbi:hypothetical protein [Streptomyces sp. NPDC059009]|uniref:hypothetical protein n=1 Tax=Streptomyces sp. NPDC059009 TaxID=3346694 RepID=UPI0036A3F133